MKKTIVYKLYCGTEFITYLGEIPNLNDIIKIDELHEAYRIKKIEGWNVFGILLRRGDVNIIK